MEDKILIIKFIFRNKHIIETLILNFIVMNEDVYLGKRNFPAMYPSFRIFLGIN